MKRVSEIGEEKKERGEARERKRKREEKQERGKARERKSKREEKKERGKARERKRKREEKQERGKAKERNRKSALLYCPPVVVPARSWWGNTRWVHCTLVQRHQHLPMTPAALDITLISASTLPC
jgi:hypothetical protein